MNKILIVDDEPDLTQVSTLALEYHGFKVDSFNDPQLSKYAPGLYDLVILDVKMPKMSGFELYHEIKKKTTTLTFVFLQQVSYIMRNSGRENTVLWTKICLFESQLKMKN
jgi:DNA-binding response OmpR family regulator